MARNQAVFDSGAPPPCPGGFNIGAYVLDSGQAPDKTALILTGEHGAEAFSYAALRDMVRGSMTGLMEHGVRPGDRVLLRIGHSLDFPRLFFALAGMGAVPVPTAPGLTKPEVDRIATLLRPHHVIAAQGLAVPDTPILPVEDTHTWTGLPPAPWAETAANDPAYIIFTSGTGGVARGVVHAHRAAWARRMMWAGWYGLTPDDRLLHAGAFNWTFTLGTGLTDPWAAGATAIIHTGPRDPGIWADLIRDHAVTLFAAAPGVFRQLLAARDITPADLPTLRHALSAGEALPPPLRARWEAATGTPVLEALGMTECSTYASQSPGQPEMRPQPGRRLAILAEDGTAPVTPGTLGRIALSSRDPGLMLGYLQPDGSHRLPLTGEWFVTGDMGEMSAAGTLTHHGRGDDILNAQGFRVSALEVEAALLAHPLVIEAAVLALPVRRDVEVLAAIAVAAPGADVTEDALAAHCAARLADYKCPRLIRLADALPRTANGKVVKRQLIALYGWQEAHP